MAPGGRGNERWHLAAGRMIDPTAPAVGAGRTPLFGTAVEIRDQDTRNSFLGPGRPTWIFWYELCSLSRMGSRLTSRPRAVCSNGRLEAYHLLPHPIPFHPIPSVHCGRVRRVAVVCGGRVRAYAYRRAHACACACFYGVEWFAAKSDGCGEGWRGRCCCCCCCCGRCGARGVGLEWIGGVDVGACGVCGVREEGACVGPGRLPHARGRGRGRARDAVVERGEGRGGQGWRGAGGGRG